MMGGWFNWYGEWGDWGRGRRIGEDREGG